MFQKFLNASLGACFPLSTLLHPPPLFIELLQSKQIKKKSRTKNDTLHTRTYHWLQLVSEHLSCGAVRDNSPRSTAKSDSLGDGAGVLWAEWTHESYCGTAPTPEQRVDLRCGLRGEWRMTRERETSGGGINLVIPVTLLVITWREISF